MSALHNAGMNLPHGTELCLEISDRPVQFPPADSASDGMVTTRIKGFNETGEALISWPESSSPTVRAAQTLVVLGQRDIGREVVVSLVRTQDHVRPVIMGLLQKPVAIPPAKSDKQGGWNIQSDGKRMVLTAQEELELCCGKARIILTKAGKVILQGEYVLSQSSGVNRIKGGSVQIN